MADGPLLILGGGPYQVPTVQKAESLGIRTLVLDWGENPPARALATHFEMCDTTNIAGALTLAHHYKVSGVMAPASDVAVPTQAAICLSLGLPGPSQDAAGILTHKTRFRHWCREQGVVHPDFMELIGTELPDEIPFKEAILKPDFASGGRGVQRVSSRDDLRRAWPHFIAASPNGLGVLERWIAGVDVTLEGFLIRGQLSFAMITNRRSARPPNVATTAHTFPSELDERAQDAIRTCVEDLAARLGYANGPVDADLIFHPHEGAYILEMSPRLGGNNLSKLAWTTHRADLVSAAIYHAMGDASLAETVIARKHPICSASTIILNSPEAGVLTYRSPSDGAEIEGLADLEIDYPSGGHVPAFTSGRDRLGAMTLMADHSKDLPKLLESAYRSLRWTITPSSRTDQT